MKPAQSKAIIDDIKKRGYIWDAENNTYLPPNLPRAVELSSQMKGNTKKKNNAAERLKSGWIDDYRNLRNKDSYTDANIRLIHQLTGLTVWPEFHFLTDRLYRFDYAIPISQDNTVLKIAIEVEGGIWAKGNSGHSSGKGIARDMDKSSLAAVHGWTLIRRTPSNVYHTDTIDLINRAIDTIKGISRS